jgi:hypothetical protein
VSFWEWNFLNDILSHKYPCLHGYKCGQ